eukprot:CAMPEP_0172394304 /NCGR_PEP_ID=MMETSP1061-20121228/14409_1 /TAXON_ID=37318 /ORGANISM="Pseudo-nitzschia pungens, Strain cf. pungens" /LENGTH=456 /DNA_ID=CAMNT_0013125627 /DNA_START=137 /DNA_END=1507 /DNA_ORIENTATION=+
MFEESSSDEDEKKPVDTKTTDDGDGKAAGNGDDNDNDNENDNENDNDSGGEKDSSEKKKSSTAGLFDDSSDDDDDDAVFDDAGAVVGSSAPPSAKKKNSSSNDLEGDGTQERSAARVNRTQHATVLNADRPEEGISLHMTKLPNVVAIQSSAFDEAEYDEKEEQEQYKGYVHNMIRWRYMRDENGTLVRDGADGSLLRESNTKLVKWSDGSFTLHIGKEAFDIQNVDSSTSGGFSGLNGYVYLSQKATFKNEENPDGDEDEAQNGGTVLECVGPVASRLVAKPSSLQSESHKSLTVAVRQRTVKRAKIAQYMTEEDPEKLKQERIKYNADADKLKQRKRSTGGGNYRSGGGGRRPGMNRGYLEASDDEGYDTVNLRALKKGSANNYDDGMDYYGEESDDDYDQSFANRNRKRQRKAAVEEDSDDDEEMVFDDDDDDDEVVKIHQKKKSAAVLDDDE